MKIRITALMLFCAFVFASSIQGKSLSKIDLITMGHLFKAAVKNKKLDEMKKLLKNPKVAKHIEGSLFIAAEKGFLNIVKFLTTNRLTRYEMIEDDVNQALVKAAQNGHEEIVHYLVKNKNTRYKMISGGTFTSIDEDFDSDGIGIAEAFVEAVKNNHLPIVTFFATHQTTKQAITSLVIGQALIEAAVQGNLEVIKYFVKTNKTIQKQLPSISKSVNQALALAAQNKHKNIVLFFINNKVTQKLITLKNIDVVLQSTNLNKKNLKYLENKKATLFIKAAKNGNLETIKMFLKESKQLPISAQKIGKALLESVKNNQEEVVTFFATDKTTKKRITKNHITNVITFLASNECPKEIDTEKIIEILQEKITPKIVNEIFRKALGKNNTNAINFLINNEITSKLISTDNIDKAFECATQNKEITSLIKSIKTQRNIGTQAINDKFKAIMAQTNISWQTKTSFISKNKGSITFDGVKQALLDLVEKRDVKIIKLLISNKITKKLLNLAAINEALKKNKAASGAIQNFLDINELNKTILNGKIAQLLKDFKKELKK